MRFWGVVMVVLGTFVSWQFWEDPAEGRIARPLFIAIAGCGLLLYFEGLRKAMARDLEGLRKEIAGGLSATGRRSTRSDASTQTVG